MSWSHSFQSLNQANTAHPPLEMEKRMGGGAESGETAVKAA